MNESIPRLEIQRVKSMRKRLLALLFVLSSLVAASASQKTGTLKGKIENEKGKPLAGADVRAMRSRDHSVKETKTDQAGNYSLELQPDDYTVSFDAEGYQGGTLVQMQQVEEGQETALLAQLRRSATPKPDSEGVGGANRRCFCGSAGPLVQNSDER